MGSKGTSKEALNKICDECYRKNDCDKDRDGYCPNFTKVYNDLEVLEIILNRCSPHKLNNSTYEEIEGIHFNIENHDDGYQKVKDLFMPIWRERASKITQENYDAIQTNEDITLLDSTKKLIAFYESKELNKNPFLKKELELSYLKAVQNELEILEILKPYIQVECEKLKRNDGLDEITCWLKVGKYGGTLIDEEKYNLIKEWLNND